MRLTTSPHRVFFVCCCFLFEDDVQFFFVNKKKSQKVRTGKVCERMDGVVALAGLLKVCLMRRRWLLSSLYLLFIFHSETKILTTTQSILSKATNRKILQLMQRAQSNCRNTCCQVHLLQWPARFDSIQPPSGLVRERKSKQIKQMALKDGWMNFISPKLVTALLQRLKTEQNVNYTVV